MRLSTKFEVDTTTHGLVIACHSCYGYVTWPCDLELWPCDLGQWSYMAVTCLSLKTLWLSIL